MEIKVNLLSTGHKFRPGTRITPTTLTIHNTGNPSSTAANERAWLDNPTNVNSPNFASWHYVVDGTEVILAIPENELAFHAKNGNRTSIGIEICEIPGSYENGVKLVAFLLKKYNWGVDRLRTHRDWTRKNCPRLILPIWPKFVNDVQQELTRLNNEEVRYVRSPLKIELNNEQRTFDGVVVDGRSFAPIRALLEALGYQVRWDEARSVIVLSKEVNVPVVTQSIRREQWSK